MEGRARRIWGAGLACVAAVGAQWSCTDPLPACADGDKLDQALCSIIGDKCVPSETSGPVADACGLFVSSSKGNDAAPGTKAAPVKSMKKAIELALAGQKPIYACGEDFVEVVEASGGIVVFGGLDCSADWAYLGAGAMTKITAAADQIPMRILGGTLPTFLYDVHVLAAAGSAPGSSSIAVLVEGGQTRFVRSTLKASKGALGAPGEAYTTAAAAGENGVPGKPSCGVDVSGPDGPLNQCGDEMSLGGTAGNGGSNQADNGADGLPMSNKNGGLGQDNANKCSNGTLGADGIGGTEGPPASGIGTITAMGFRGIDGLPGTAGKPGQGGGGGGGARSISTNGTNLCGTGDGASGGSGASGGCGGSGGKGGGFGGSSIALLSIGASLTFEAVMLVTSDGGSGGMGRLGQTGGLGGAMGGAGGKASVAMLSDGCAGGTGGKGGDGGPGGKGLDGHSIGLAFTGTEPPSEGLTVQKGAAGGVSGMSADRLSFSAAN